ncbi:hypothetical protein [Elizabethkingia sp. JS20170427COW]|uniref:hypothetical protein n=1 Tax=Elizabethkingia sp. JS20170427COW TaxID=2583851 RepID=UPI0011106BED|nr:hypothetical protein [Elizabethkingia sp. JS20170427COW]QCX53813.1 hypothetical protein FGE20_08760 [Elizabethkingia sp. JS20170427COW]
MSNQGLDKLSVTILIICALGFIISIFTPIWSIYLLAPQYPEGLSMFIHASKLSGDVDIINGLNHYIGMKIIKEEDFWEFKVLPYVLAAFAVIAVILAVLRKKVGLYIFTIFYALFGIAFMYDFWKWEYDYGHNLDPNAAIVVPGMSYQPPLFGEKILLNFTAYSYPNVGGTAMVLIAVLLIIASIRMYKKSKN